VKTASEFFRELLPWLNSGRAELTDDRRLTNQFAGLERRRTRGGRETIDRPPGRHNDIANAAALALMRAAPRVRLRCGSAVTLCLRTVAAC
jgi:hypothetical protein